MRIAILGATSQIARDLTVSLALSAQGQHDLSLFARRPEKVEEWCKQLDLCGIECINSFEYFTPNGHYDAIINFVGVGNPAVAQAIGASILDVTLQYDSLALDYLKVHPSTRYIFISSGAAYGSSFAQPVRDDTPTTFAINHLRAQDWYGAAKFHAECRHRALSEFGIVDIRMFSYFSRTQDRNARFLMSDILRAIQFDQILQVSAENVVRDFLHPSDFHRLVMAVLSASPTNLAIDCYSKAPVDKQKLLQVMQAQFGLGYEMAESHAIVNATGSKSHYYSLSRLAAAFGYQPQLTSLEGILQEITAVLQFPHFAVGEF